MATQTPDLRSAARHYRLSALLARRAVTAARRARPRGLVTVAGTIVAHQVAQATMSQTAVAQVLAEQDVQAAAAGPLNTAAFTTSTDNLLAMLDQAAVDLEFDRLVASLVQDAGRAAESVATAARPGVGHVRHLVAPSCARCAVLAGRVYRYSAGFQRHPNCDCTMTPVRDGDTRYAVDVAQLVRAGQVHGLSKADQQAVLDGADPGQVVNVRRQAAGLRASGRVLARRGRPTPEGIYAVATDHDDAIELLIRYGYLL